MRLSTVPIEPVRKRREVPLRPAEAFELFTERMAEWWPLATHSLGGERSAGVRVERRVGGRVIESTDDGTEHSWADVIAWDPPHRLALAWHPSPEPEAATIVDVRFRASDVGTVLELEHRAFEELGDDGADTRSNYDTGWDGVLDLYVQALAVRSA